MSPNQKNIMLLNLQNFICSVRISHLRLLARLFVLATHSVRSAQVVTFPFRQRSRFHWHAGPRGRKLTAVAAKKIRVAMMAVSRGTFLAIDH